MEKRKARRAKRAARKEIALSVLLSLGIVLFWTWVFCGYLDGTIW